MLRHAMVSDMPHGRSVHPPPPPGKLAAQKIAFWRVLLHPNFLANKKGGSNLIIIQENNELFNTDLFGFNRYYVKISVLNRGCSLAPTLLQ